MFSPRSISNTRPVYLLKAQRLIVAPVNVHDKHTLQVRLLYRACRVRASRPFFRPSIRQSVRPSVRPSVRQYVVRLSVRSSIRSLSVLSVFPPIRPFVSPIRVPSVGSFVRVSLRVCVLVCPLVRFKYADYFACVPLSVLYTCVAVAIRRQYGSSTSASSSTSCAMYVRPHTCSFHLLVYQFVFRKFSPSAKSFRLTVSLCSTFEVFSFFPCKSVMQILFRQSM